MHVCFMSFFAVVELTKLITLTGSNNNNSSVVETAESLELKRSTLLQQKDELNKKIQSLTPASVASATTSSSSTVAEDSLEDYMKNLDNKAKVSILLLLSAIFSSSSFVPSPYSFTLSPASC